MCIEVMSVNAMASAIVCVAASPSASASTPGWMSVATNGSPTQPSPSEASVMPSCVTDSASSRWSVRLLAYAARLLPSWISVSRRDERIFTQQNSAATKKPFMKMRNATKMS